jgi:hypothetical protein
MDAAHREGVFSLLVGTAQRMSQWKFFNRHEYPVSSWQVGAWWESRRLPYNLMVGAVGMVTVSLCLATAVICEHFLGQPIGIPNPPAVAVIGVVAYGVMANVCYTGGWLAEMIVREIWPQESAAFGQISFCLGLLFSLALTLLPGILVATFGAFSLLQHALTN